MFDIITKIKPEYISLLIYLQALKYKDVKEVKIGGQKYNLENPKDREKLEQFLINELVAIFLGLLANEKNK
ncbi:MAG: hypothetical protein N2504_07625 [candidate division WOR-3 bacterium]|nr:hypothetical protein [candidate division WOR-3 bacterium]